MPACSYILDAMHVPERKITVTTLARLQRGAEIVLPLYASRPAAGFPAPGDDLVEKVLDLNDLLIEHPAATFFVRVEGDSMEGMGIFSGDVLVVDRARTPRDGSIVVAAVFGEMVVKCFRKEQHGARLESAHAGYAPIRLENGDDVYVWGVVVGSVRRFV